MPSQNLDQQRAAYAWACVVAAGPSGDYLNLARSAPALIMNNGLMQTLAYYQDKGKTHHKLLERHIRCWLAQRFRERWRDAAAMEDGFNAAMEELFLARSPLFRRATDETLALLRWIGQFAKAHDGGG
jgi:CRISPR-associated protein Cmr5